MSKFSTEKLEELKGYPLSYRLQKLRWWSGFTQEDVANHLHCGQGSVSSWEQGKRYPNGRTLEKIIDLYDLPGDFFLDLDIKRLKLMRKKREELDD